jgi:hypothetical protein
MSFPYIYTPKYDRLLFLSIPSFVSFPHMRIHQHFLFKIHSFVDPRFGPSLRASLFHITSCPLFWVQSQMILRNYHELKLRSGFVQGLASPYAIALSARRNSEICLVLMDKYRDSGNYIYWAYLVLKPFRPPSY